MYNIHSPQCSLIICLVLGISSISLWCGWTHHKGHGKAVLAVTICIGGALDGDTDLSIGGAGEVMGDSGMFGPGLLDSVAEQMNILFLV